TLGQQTCIVDGAEELCKALAGRYKMYLVTNGIGRIQRSRFGKSALKPYFDGIFISEEMGTAKPEKAYFDHVLREIGSPEREKCLVIGDSLTSDCDGAIASGLDICWYNPKNGDAKNRTLTYTVTKLSDIIRLLDESETELD
ncbi:MAG: HAD-IA family hydrolase, partial [Clostridia bacterium]|nr:HAD-IA family hydrolase [Clostridia bacterium]